ncbi:MAG TPA: DedA family protein [Microbacteriaceae bacterium]|jgi:membrane-associated protein|nr:DedA family protein [Microbacteriaceae bacterium]
MLHAAALDEQLSGVLSTTGVVIFYLVVWGLVFAGTAVFLGIFIPFITGDSLLFAAGIVTAASANLNSANLNSANLNIVVLAAGVGIAAFLGDQVGFVLGRRYGRSYLDRHGGRRTQAAIAKTEHFYRTFGWWAIVVARFMPWARVFIPVIAGVGRMNYYRFLTSNLVGALAWGAGMTVVGYFAASIPGVKGAAYVIGGCFILASIVFGIRAWRADRRASRADAPSQVAADGS